MSGDNLQERRGNHWGERGFASPSRQTALIIDGNGSPESQNPLRKGKGLGDIK